MSESVELTGGGGAREQPPSSGSSVPFEDRSLPFMTRILETVKMAFADPIRLFSNMPADDIGPPVLYGVILGTFVSVLWIVWEMLFGGMAMLADHAPVEDVVLGTGILSFMLVASPILVAVGLFINAAIFHLMLLIVGDGSRGFGVTLRAYCYGTTPTLLAIVPICGGIVGGVWSAVLIIIAAIYGHQTDGWRAVVAYFLPMIFCCCCGWFFLATFLGFLGLVGN